MLKYTELLFLAYKAAQQASKAILNVYDSAFDIQIKADQSPLTLADLQSNTIINKVLLPAGYPILSEENKEVSYDIRSNWDTFWMVDPLDGTKEFINRNGEFSINIALVNNGFPVIGLLYIPVTNSIYFAIQGLGSYFIESDNKPLNTYDELIQYAQAIKYKATSSNLVRVGTSRSHLSQPTLDFIESVAKQGAQCEVIPSGSAQKFGLFAHAKLDIYPRLAPTMEWDTAAGQIIAEEAGGEVITWPNRKRLSYNKLSLTNPHFIVQPIGFLYL